ncbi:uncharacterized protein [Littorina saxatilis]|uniref:DDE Tnp4 domain-containing protein n=1 Tax=Littorina saxatilis TaxID=31220 RepID=A0AAN9BMW5_9CAEN
MDSSDSDQYDEDLFNAQDMDTDDEFDREVQRRRRTTQDFDLLLLNLKPSVGRRGILAENFDLSKYTDYQCQRYFRFHTAQDVEQLRGLLRMPDMMRTETGTVAPGLEVLCITLRRLAYPCRYVDLGTMFPRSESALCQLFNLGLNHIYDNFSPKIIELNQPWLTLPQLHMYCDVIADKGAPLQNCWGFIDGTVRPICRPSEIQRELFNGHKRVHGIKFQSIVTPDGLIANLFGPMSGRRHDAALLNASGLLDHMERHYNINGQPLCIYGDPAYPQRPHLYRPFLGHNLTPQQQQFNTDMSSVRQVVEFGFGKVVENWAFLDYKKNLKLFLSPVGKLYHVGAILTNCLTCMYPAHGGLVNYFEIDPPSIDEYLQ